MKSTADKPILPIDQDLERAILGAILLDNSCFLQVAERISSDDFGLDSHRRIFRALQELHDAGKPLDYYTLCTVLGDRGELEFCGGVAYVTDLVDITRFPRLRNVSHYLDRLLDLSARRTIIYAADSAIQRASDSSGAGDVAGELQERLNRVTARAQASSCVPVAEVVADVAGRLVSQHYSPQDFIGLPTGIHDLDRLTSGLVDGENIVIAADPGGGKTSFALNVAELNCRNDVPVQIFSLEMTKESLLLRLASGLTSINHLKFRNGGRMSIEELDSALEGLNKIKGWPLWIDDSSGLTPRELYARGRMQVAKGAKLIIVDFLQRIVSSGDTLDERITAASQAVTQLAKDSKRPVLNLSQLSRRKDRRGQKPELDDLRGSGTIEQDAHAAIFLWIEQVVNDSGIKEFTGNDALLLRKNRNGPTGEIPAHYDSKIMKWGEPRGESYLYQDGKGASGE